MPPRYLSGFSPRFQRLSRSSWAGCLCITHPFATRSIQQAGSLSFDLHVLGTPPAFILSQDQTLHLTLSSPDLLIRIFYKLIDVVCVLICSVQFSKISCPLPRECLFILPLYLSFVNILFFVFFRSLAESVRPNLPSFLPSDNPYFFLLKIL